MSHSLNLGEKVSTYEPCADEVKRWKMLLVSAYFVLTPLIAVLIYFAAPIPVVSDALIGGLVIGLSGPAVVLMWLIPAMLRSGQSIAFYNHGFVLKRGSNVVASRYEDVLGIDEDIEMFSFLPKLTRVHKLTPVVADCDTRIVLSEGGVTNFAEVRRSLVAMTSAAQVPRLVNRLRQGETIEAGALTFKPDGVQVQDQTCRWKDVAGIQLHPSEGTVMIVRRSGSPLDTGKWMTAVPLHFLVAELAQQMSLD